MINHFVICFVNQCLISQCFAAICRRLRLSLDVVVSGVALRSGAAMKTHAPDHLLHHVGQRIRALRMAAGLTQEDLAGRIGMAVTNIHRIEAGTQNLTLRTVVRVAQGLQVDPLDVFAAYTTDDEPMPQRKPPLRLKQLESLGWVLQPKSTLADSPGVPIFDLRARAGAPVGLAVPEIVGYATPPRERRLHSEGLFIGRILGNSMEPLVPSGAWCLFRQAATGLRLRSVVLLALDTAADASSYILKQVGALELLVEGRIRVRLDSTNRTVSAIMCEVRDESDLHVVGELVEVLK